MLSSARNAGTSANCSAHFWAGRWRIPATRTWQAARPDDCRRKTQPAIAEAQWPVLDRALAVRRGSNLLQQILRTRDFGFPGDVFDIELLHHAVIRQHGVALGGGPQDEGG